MLRKMDKIVRKEVRKWLHLPDDVPVGFFHAAIREGGLGIPAMESWVPETKRRRINNMEHSEWMEAREISRGRYVQNLRKWCGKARYRNEDWARLLYASVDGADLREVGKTKASYTWVNDPYVSIPPRDYIQYIRTRINALPSAVRTSRGRRENPNVVNCRAGCGRAETTAHIIQQCHRTHGGRILRHDAVARKIAELLDRKGFRVAREKIFPTAEGPRKPDILAAKEEVVHVLDVQIVSANAPLIQQGKRKADYYKRNIDLLSGIAVWANVHRSQVKVKAITISWKGIWATDAVETLRQLDMSLAAMKGITTRVLQGSHTNFSRFNQSTTMQRNARRGNGRNQ